MQYMIRVQLLTAKMSDPDDLQTCPAGGFSRGSFHDYPIEADDEQKALDEFHALYPIGCLEEFDVYVQRPNPSTYDRRRMVDMLTWTALEDDASKAEGWAVFSTGDELEIARLDDPADMTLDEHEPFVPLYSFDTDMAAWQHCWERAQHGSIMHTKALWLHGQREVQVDRVKKYITSNMTEEELACR